MRNDDEDRAVTSAEHDMEQVEREMEREDEQLGEDIEEARDELEDLRRMQGDAAADFAGDWRETGDQAGGEDPSGAGSSSDVERD